MEKDHISLWNESKEHIKSTIEDVVSKQEIFKKEIKVLENKIKDLRENLVYAEMVMKKMQNYSLVHHTFVKLLLMMVTYIYLNIRKIMKMM